MVETVPSSEGLIKPTELEQIQSKISTILLSDDSKFEFQVGIADHEEVVKLTKDRQELNFKNEATSNPPLNRIAWFVDDHQANRFNSDFFSNSKVSQNYTGIG